MPVTNNIQQDHLLAAWQTNNRVTEFFFENLPDELWNEKIQGAPQRSIRMIAGHIHNARCMWIKMVGKQFGIKPPAGVNRRNVDRATLLRALKQSNKAFVRLLKVSSHQSGDLKIKIPWSNIPPDLVHFITYLVAHEAHHRGQIVIVARALGHRLPPEITNGLWQWQQRNKEVQQKNKKAN